MNNLCVHVCKNMSFSILEGLNSSVRQKGITSLSTAELSQGECQAKNLCDMCLRAVWCKVSEMISSDRQHIHSAMLSAYLSVLQVLYLGSIVAVSLAVAEDLEPWHTNSVNHWTTIRKELHISHLKHSLSWIYTNRISVIWLHMIEWDENICEREMSKWVTSCPALHTHTPTCSMQP